MASKAFENLLAAANKARSGGSTYSDDKENQWMAEQDKAGNGFAIIRFLPGKTEDDIPFVKIYNHGFQNESGKWFVENCPTTLEKNCPVCEANGVLWNSGIEANKDIVRKRKRKLKYASNVLVVQDSKNPENEGKVFIFKYGQKIFDKIVYAMQPAVDDKGNPIDPDEVPINPFDPVEGANFKLKIRKVDGFANFDKSEFEDTSEIKNFDEIITQIHSLEDIVAPSKFKDFDALKEKLDKVLGGTPTVKEKNDDEKFVEKAKNVTKTTVVDDDEDDESTMEMFRSLAED